MVTVACLGDSNTLGYPFRGLFDLEENHPFSELLSRMFDIICRQYARCGASYMGQPNDRRSPGFTSCKSFEEFKRDPRPDAIVLCLGTNDSTIFKPKDAESVATLTRKVAELVTHLNGLPLLVISPLGIRHKPAIRALLKDIIFAEARKHHHPDCVFLDVDDLDPKFYQNDKKHLTVDGQQELARRIARPLCELLQNELGAERLPRRMVRYLSAAPATGSHVLSAPLHRAFSAPPKPDDESSSVLRTSRAAGDSNVTLSMRQPPSPPTYRGQRHGTENFNSLSARSTTPPAGAAALSASLMRAASPGNLAPAPRTNALGTAALGAASLTTTMSDTQTRAVPQPPRVSRYGMSTRGQFRRQSYQAKNMGFASTTVARTRISPGARTSARDAPRREERRSLTRAADDEDGAISELGRESTGVSSWIKGDQTSSASRDGTDDNLSKNGNDAASYVSRLSSNTTFLTESKELMDGEPWELSVHRSKQPRKKWKPDRDFPFPSQKDPFQKVYEMLRSLNPKERDSIVNHQEFPVQVRNALKDDPLVTMWRRGDRGRIKPGDVVSTLQYERRYQMPQEVECGSELKLDQTISITAGFCETSDAKKGPDGAVFGLRRANDPYGPYALAYYRTGEVYINGNIERSMPRWKSQDRISIKYAYLKNSMARFVISVNQKPGKTLYGIKTAAFVSFVAITAPSADRIELSNSNVGPNELWRYRGSNPDTMEILHVASCCRFATPDSTAVSDEESAPATEEVPAEASAVSVDGETQVVEDPCVLSTADGDGKDCEKTGTRSASVPAALKEDKSEACVLNTQPPKPTTASPRAEKNENTVTQHPAMMEKGNTVATAESIISLASSAEETAPTAGAPHHEECLNTSSSTVTLSVPTAVQHSETTASVTSIAPHHEESRNTSSSTVPSSVPTAVQQSETTALVSSIAPHHEGSLHTSSSMVPSSVPTTVQHSETTALATSIAPHQDGSLNTSSSTVPSSVPTAVQHSETTALVTSIAPRQDGSLNTSSSTGPSSVSTAVQHSETTALVTSIAPHHDGSLKTSSSTVPSSVPTAVQQSETTALVTSIAPTAAISSTIVRAICTGATTVAQASVSDVVVSDSKKPNVQAQEAKAVASAPRKRAPRRTKVKATSSGAGEPALGAILSPKADAASTERQNPQADTCSIKGTDIESKCVVKAASSGRKPHRRKREGAKAPENKDGVATKAPPARQEQVVDAPEPALRTRTSGEVSGNEDAENEGVDKAPPVRQEQASCNAPEPARQTRTTTEDLKNKEAEDGVVVAAPSARSERAVPEASEPASQTRMSAETSEPVRQTSTRDDAPENKDADSIILVQARTAERARASAEAFDNKEADNVVKAPPACRTRVVAEVPKNEAASGGAIVNRTPEKRKRARTQASKSQDAEGGVVAVAKAPRSRQKRTTVEAPKNEDAEGGAKVNVSLVQQKPERAEAPEDDVITSSSSLRRRPAAAAIVAADDTQPKRRCIAKSPAAEDEKDAAEQPTYPYLQHVFIV